MKKSDSIDDSSKWNSAKVASTPSHHEKIFAAIFYGLSSFTVIFANKVVMTEYQFHYFDFLAMFQFLMTTLILSILILAKKIDVPYLSFEIFREILPISLMFLGNIITGLGGKYINLASAPRIIFFL